MVPQKLVDKVLRDYAANRSGRGAARRAGLSLTTTYRILASHGIKLDGLDLHRQRVRKLPPTSQVLAEYERGDSLPQIAERYNCSPSAVGNALKRAGVRLRPRGNHGKKLTREEALKMAEHYKALGSQQAVAVAMGTGQGRVSQGLRMLGIHCGKDHMRGQRHPSWRGGKILTNEGYVRSWVDTSDPLRCMAGVTGYALEHRLVMARALGRPLSGSETVHHINGDRTDNRLSNLQLRFGKHGKGAVLVCAQCGSHEIRYDRIAIET